MLVLTSGSPDADSDAPEAWDEGEYSDSVLVGLIDSGVDFENPAQSDNDPSDPNGHGTHLDVVAPGVGILSLRAAGTDMYAPCEPHVHIIEEDYYLASGTSMACPHVAGVAALILSNSPGLSADSVRGLIRHTADDLLDPNGDGSSLVGQDLYSGWGRVNAQRAVESLSGARALISSPGENELVFGTVQILGTAVGGEWAVDYGRGVKPTMWIEIAASTTPSEGGLLATWDTEADSLNGIYALRLRVGEIHEDRVRVRVANATMAIIASPQEGDTVRNMSLIRGSASAPGFAGYRLAFGVGEDPAEWEVITESTRPAVDTILARWVLGPVQEGSYTCLLEVESQSQVAADTVRIWVANTFQPGWPQPFIKSGSGRGSVTLGDIDGDVYDEVVFASKGVYAWNHDGSLVDNWPQDTDKDIASSPALADFDGDGFQEIVGGGHENNRVYAWNHAGTPFADNSLFRPFREISRAALGDIDADGVLEIVVIEDEEEKEKVTISALNADGSQVPGWPVVTLVSTFYGCFGPVLGDLDHDGRIEVVIGSITGVEGEGYLCAWRHDGKPFADPLGVGDGSLVLGSFGHPLLADVDGDRAIDITARSIKLGHDYEKIYAWNGEGDLLSGWPLYTLYPCAVYPLFNSPAVGDLDGDNDLEVVMEATDSRVYVWDLPATHHPDRVEWGMHLHDRWHSGTYGLVPVPPEGVVEAPSITIPTSFSLQPNFPNPFNPATVIPYVVPGRKATGRERGTLRVFNIAGQLVRTLVDGPLSPGYHQVMWDGKDERGGEVASGIYLCRLRADDCEIARQMVLIR